MSERCRGKGWPESFAMEEGMVDGEDVGIPVKYFPPTSLLPLGWGE